MAAHTNCFAWFSRVDNLSRGESYRSERLRGCIMTSHTLNTLRVIGGDSSIHSTDGRAISTQEILKAHRCMTLGAGCWNAIWVCSSIVPMAEGLTSHIIVTRGFPSRHIGNFNSRLHFHGGSCGS